jgi:hypothetical protein
MTSLFDKGLDSDRRDEPGMPMANGDRFRMSEGEWMDRRAVYEPRGVDVGLEWSKACLWIADHPSRRPRGKYGCRQFFTRWLNRALERSVERNATRPARELDQEWKKNIGEVVEPMRDGESLAAEFKALMRKGDDDS